MCVVGWSKHRTASVTAATTGALAVNGSPGGAIVNSRPMAGPPGPSPQRSTQSFTKPATENLDRSVRWLLLVTPTRSVRVSRCLTPSVYLFVCPEHNLKRIINKNLAIANTNNNIMTLKSGLEVISVTESSCNMGMGAISQRWPRVVFGDGGAISHPSPEFWVRSVLHSPQGFIPCLFTCIPLYWTFLWPFILPVFTF